MSTHSYSEELMKMREMVRNVRDDYPDAIALLTAVAETFEECFEQDNDIGILDEAIVLRRRLLEFTPQADVEQSLRYWMIATDLQRRSSFLGDSANESEALSWKRVAAELADGSDSTKLGMLCELAIDFRTRFQHYGLPGDIEEAITVQQLVLDIIPDDDAVDKANQINNLGISHSMAFTLNGDVSHVEAAISLQERAAELISDGHPDKAMILVNLGTSYLARFEKLSEPDNIEAAIQVYRQAAAMMPANGSHMATLYNLLGNAYRARFARFGRLDDLEEAIEVQRRSVEMLSEDGPRKAKFLHNLGTSCLIHYEFKGSSALSDLEEAIRTGSRAVEMTPDAHPDKPIQLNGLGTALLFRFQCTADLSDLDAAFAAHQRGAELAVKGHQNQDASQLNNIGSCYITRFEHYGRLEDLDAAIQAQIKSVALTPSSHAVRAIRLNNLGDSYRIAFDRRGQLEDIEEAIRTFREAVAATPDDHPDMMTRLDALGTALCTRFESYGELSDIEEAIEVQRSAVERTPDDHLRKAGHLANLGNSYIACFARHEERRDIDAAVATHRRAVNITQDDDPDKPLHLNNFGNAFRIRFEHYQSMDDIEAAVEAHLHAVEATPDDHIYKASRLNNLGTSHRIHFEHTKRLDEIKAAIDAHKKAVDLTPADHLGRPGRLSNLGVSHRLCFEVQGDTSDLEAALSVQRLAVELTPNGHIDAPGRLINLGSSLLAMLRSTPSRAVFLDAAKAFHDAAYVPGRPSDQFSAAVRLTRLHAEFPGFCGPPQDSLPIHQRVIELIPLVAWLGQSVSRRYQEVYEKIGDAVHVATATALQASRPVQALEWFEGGRAVVWNQTLNLRTPLDGLRDVHPEHAENLQRISRQLENGTQTDLSESQSDRQNTSLDRVRDHRLLADEYQKLVDKIHTLPGFEDFLRPRRVRDMASAVRDGPVVCINVHQSRCDALVLHVVSGESNPSVQHIPLPGFSPSKAESIRETWRSYLGSQGVLNSNRNYRAGGPRPWDDKEDATEALGDLWDLVVGPILDALSDNVLVTEDPGKVPHVTWCTSGALAFLPLHAAGRYDGPGDRKAFDKVISSYTPTIGSLLERGAPTPKATSISTPRIAVVAQPEPPSYAPTLKPLSGTIDEANRLASLFPPDTRHFKRLVGTDGTADAVLHAMHEYPYVHLACHGTQSTVDPSHSAFLLYDRRLELRELMSMSMGVGVGVGELAFLSACETATGDEQVPDEAVHLAAGLLAAEYRGVVATMWAIGDRVAPEVAEDFYRALLGTEKRAWDGDDLEERGVGVARALHVAMERARSRVGEEKFVDWVPFVHYGR